LVETIDCSMKDKRNLSKLVHRNNAKLELDGPEAHVGNHAVSTQDGALG